jgi:O-Antigen ligase
MKPQNFEERLVWYPILYTYVLYISGLLYIVNSTIAWILLFYLCIKLWNQKPETPAEEKIKIPWIIWLWIICMLVMVVGGYIGYIDFNQDIKGIIRGLLNWTREWALFALFPLAGCCLKIRPQLIYRAVCILCLQSLFFIPISYGAYLLKIPNIIYSSPLERITQNGPIYFDVVLYFKEFDSGGGFRLTLFAPWSPALALLAIIYFFFALQEKNQIWRWIGIFTSLIMVYLTAARTAIICLPFVTLLIWLLTNFHRPHVQIISSFTCFMFGIFSSFVIELVRDLNDNFTDSRQGSSRVRSVLARIGLERFKDAPIWGHAIQQPGFKGTANMPIGSHHTWIGLLFTKGLVGFFAFLIPIVCTLIYLLVKAQKNVTAKVGLSFLLTLIVFTFTDNQETLAYLYWTGLIVMGISFKQERQTLVYKPEILETSYLTN